MKLHPLTPRKSTLKANLGGTAAAFAVILLGLVINFIALPPVAWLPAGDEARVADAALLMFVVQSLLADAVADSGFFATVDGILYLPWAIIDTAVFLDLATSLAARCGTILLAAIIAAMETHRLLLGSELAQPAVRHIDGPRLLAGRVAKSALLASWFRRYGAANTGIDLAHGLAMPRALETEHMLICGGTGAGKTTILQTVMDGVLAKGDRMLALDVKGDMTAKIPIQNVALLSLDDARGRRWDLGRDCLSREDAEELVIELVPETSDPSWSAGARRILSSLLGYLQDEYGSPSPSWSWLELERVLKHPIEVLHGIVLERDPATAVFLDTATDETRKPAMSFYLVLIANALPIVAACARMGSPKGPGFSFRHWVGSERAAQALILRQSQRHPELSAAIARLGLKFIADAAAGRTADKSAKPIWLMLDELPQIGKSPAVPRMAAIGRSAGIRVVVTVQSPAQLREIYGEDGCQHLLDNFTTKIVGRVSPGRTATEIADHWIGKRTVGFCERSALDKDGLTHDAPHREDIPVVTPEFLSDGLGLASTTFGRTVVRALIVGHGDVGLLDWPVGLWADRRASTVACRRTSETGTRSQTNTVRRAASKRQFS